MEGGSDLLEGWRVPLAPASNSKSPPPSTSPVILEEEDPLSQPKDNAATTPSLEPKARKSPPSPASNSEDALRWVLGEGQC